MSVRTHRLELTETDFIMLATIMAHAAAEIHKHLTEYAVMHPGITAEDTPVSAMGPIGEYIEKVTDGEKLPRNFIERFVQHASQVMEAVNESVQTGANQLARMSRRLDRVDGMMKAVDSMLSKAEAG